MTRSARAIVLTAAVAVFAAAEGGANAPPRVATPDLLFFNGRVAAEIHTRCAGCHSDAEMAGGYLVEPLKNLSKPALKTVRKNFRATLLQLNTETPATSPFLRKALGQDAHGGGAVYAGPAHKGYQVLRDFALGASLSNRPPEAILPKRTRASVGETLTLDGSLSSDPDGETVAYAWRIAAQPSGSAGALRGADGATARLTLDKAGMYRVRLMVHDGTLWSTPAEIVVVASVASTGAAAMAAPRPVAGDAKAKEALWKRPRLDDERLRLIRRLYIDLMWRTPRLGEIERWYPTSHVEMVDAFLKREEVWDAWYERQLYYFLLLDRFRPKEGRLTTLAKRLAEGKSSVPHALAEIVRSQYFNARNPGNDTFVTVVLEQCLGLVVQERRNIRILNAGKKMYDGYKTKLYREIGDSQADFVRIVFRQKTFAEHLLRRTFKKLHHKDIDKKRLAAVTARMMENKGAFREILTEWLKGPDYVESVKLARQKPEIPYVRSLFVDILNRTPTYDELRNVRNAFLSLADPTPIRLVMGRVLMESGEAQLPVSVMAPEQFVREQFIRLLARAPASAEAKTFEDALKNDPAVTPKVVLWTLISSPEYQGY